MSATSHPQSASSICENGPVQPQPGFRPVPRFAALATVADPGSKCHA